MDCVCVSEILIHLTQQMFIFISHEFVSAASCSPNKFPVLKKLLSQWHTEDVQCSPVQSFLMAHHIEHFCLEAIWDHVEARNSEFTFASQVFLMHALLLRLQSGTNARHHNLVRIRWTDVEKLEPTVNNDTECFSIKVCK